MKSGKSYDLISFFAPLKYTAIPYALYQSARHLRDEQIQSRNGSLLAAQRIFSLTEALGNGCKIIGIDEIHMFPAHETLVIDKLLRTGVKVIVSGLDLDYQGKMFDVMRNLLELGPREVRYKRAVCESCKSPDAMYTQVLRDSQPLLEGMPSVIPDDGTYSYKATCRYCFVKPL
jgi:thymidine kinase